MTEDLARFVSDKSKGLYTIETLQEFKTTNDFFFNPTYGFIRVQKDLFKGKYIWVHGFFWSLGIYHNAKKLSSVLKVIKDTYKAEYLLVEIPEGRRSLHGLLNLMGFEIDLVLHEIVECRKILYKLDINKYLGRNI